MVGGAVPTPSTGCPNKQTNIIEASSHPNAPEERLLDLQKADPRVNKQVYKLHPLLRS